MTRYIGRNVLKSPIKWVAVLLALTMMFSLVPMHVFARTECEHTNDLENRDQITYEGETLFYDREDPKFGAVLEEEALLAISKTARSVEGAENLFEVTLEVRTRIDIQNQGFSWTVEEYLTGYMDRYGEEPDGGDGFDQHGTVLRWNLNKFQPEEEDGWYIYSHTYQLQLNTEHRRFLPDTDLVIAHKTELTYTLLDGLAVEVTDEETGLSSSSSEDVANEAVEKKEEKEDAANVFEAGEQAEADTTDGDRMEAKGLYQKGQTEKLEYSVLFEEPMVMGYAGTFSLRIADMEGDALKEEGVALTLTNVEDNKTVYEVTCDEKGVVRVSDLPSGHRYLLESDASDEAYLVEVSYGHVKVYTNAGGYPGQLLCHIKPDGALCPSSRVFYYGTNRMPQKSSLIAAHGGLLEMGTATVTFDPDNGLEPAYEVQVSIGAKVSEPVPPTVPEGKNTFLGWFAETEILGGESFDFDTAIMEDQRLVARYSDQFLVQFFNGNGKVIHTIALNAGETIIAYTATMDELELSEGELFLHWYLAGDHEENAYVFGDAIDKNITLLPYVVGSHSVWFQSGGTIVSPITVAHGHGVVRPDDPTRFGYNFLYWSLEEDGSEYDFTTPVTESLVLYGVWEGQSVPYKVIYWVENPNLDGDPQGPGDYTFVYMETKEAKAGSTVSAATGELVFSTGDPNEPYAPELDAYAVIRYSALESGDRAEIRGEGTSTINVYFNRTVYTYVFDLAPEGAGHMDAVLQFEENGSEYRNDSYQLRLKYQQAIPAGAWPSREYVTISNHGYDLVGWKTEDHTDTWSTSRNLLADDMMPEDPGETTVYVNAIYSATPTERYPQYYFEVLNSDVPYWEYEDDYEEIELDRGSWLLKYGPYGLFDGRWYDLSEAYSVPVLTNGLVSFGAKDIEGMEPYVTFQSYKETPYLFYNRARSVLTFDAQGGILYGASNSAVFHDVIFGQPLEELVWEEPYLDDNVFKGWYTHPEYNGAGEYDLELATMAAHDLTLYAQWDPIDRIAPVYFYMNTAASTPFHMQTVYAGTQIDFTDGSLPVIGAYYEGYGELLGWMYYKTGTLVPFGNKDQVTASSLNLYANWQTDGFHMRYEAGRGTGTVEDENTYDHGALALIKGPDGLTPPTMGQVFVGWQSQGEGKSYYPNNFYKVGGNTRMVAKYAASENAVRLTYYANNNTEETIALHIEKGVEVELMGQGMFRYGSYTQLGWSLTPEGDVVYDFGEVVIVDQDMDLYAVWELPTYQVTYEPNGGEGSVVDAAAYRLDAMATVKDNLDTTDGGLGITRDHYDFVGWNSAPDGSGKTYGPGTIIEMKGNVILYAQWEEEESQPSETYTVTYEARDSDGGTVPIDEGKYESGTTVTVLGNTGGLVRNGYVFTGWNTEADESGAGYKAGSRFIIRENTVLHAVWEEEAAAKDARNVTYHPNGASGGEVPVDENLYREGDTVTILTNSGRLTRGGYTFSGWAFTESGGTVFKAGTTFVIGDEDVDLYARWSRNSSGGGNSGGGISGTVILDDEIPLTSFLSDHVWYMQGYPDHSVRPENSLTRAEVAAMFFRLIDDGNKTLPNYSANFTDVDSSAWYYQAVAYLSSHGILLGYEDGSFRGNATITRAEFAAIASRFDALWLGAGNDFSDVTSDHWAVAYINSAAAKGWITGYEDGSFRPEQKISRAEAATLMNRVLTRALVSHNEPDGLYTYTDLPKGHWAYYEIMEASHTHDYDYNEALEEIWTLFTYPMD